MIRAMKIEMRWLQRRPKQAPKLTLLRLFGVEQLCTYRYRQNPESPSPPFCLGQITTSYKSSVLRDHQ